MVRGKKSSSQIMKMVNFKPPLPYCKFDAHQCQKQNIAQCCLARLAR